MKAIMLQDLPIAIADGDVQVRLRDKAGCPSATSACPTGADLRPATRGCPTTSAHARTGATSSAQTPARCVEHPRPPLGRQLGHSPALTLYADAEHIDAEQEIVTARRASRKRCAR